MTVTIFIKKIVQFQKKKKKHQTIQQRKFISIVSTK